MIETNMRAGAGQVLLYDPEHISLTYGPNDDIRFGPKGAAEEHFALVAEDHPLLAQLLADNPLIVVVTHERNVYVCSACDPATEWKSRVAYQSHARARHGPATVKL